MTPELHRPVATDRIALSGMEVEVVATGAECVAIAERLRVPSVASLACRFRLSRADSMLGLPDGAILAEGTLTSAFEQECVVSLEPFPVTLREEFRVRFVPEGAETFDDDPESDDEIPYALGVIDLGEAAVEQLALSLDPYPRKPGAKLPDSATDPDAGPFATLARLKPSSPD